MKIVILSSRFPYPLDKGDKLRLYHQIRVLSQKHRIILISLTESRISTEARAAMAEFCEKVITFYISKPRILWNTFIGVLRGLPAQVAYFYDRRIHQNIKQVIHTESPDHIYCQLIRMAEYVKHFSLPKTIDYMDCFYLSTTKRAKYDKGPKQLLWASESLRVRNYETGIYPYFNHHTIISTIDRNAMDPGGIKSLTLVPNGLNESYHFAIEPRPIRDIDLLFLGNLSYFSNIAAVEFLLNKIIPLLDKTVIKKIVIAGAHPVEAIKKWILPLPSVQLIENPADTRQIYQRAKLFVAPIFAGTGQQNKILEAIASGCMVICTTEVQTALGIKSPELIHVQQSAQGFASEIQQMIQSPDRFQIQVRQAQEYIQSHFSWEKNTEILENLMSGPSSDSMSGNV